MFLSTNATTTVAAITTIHTQMNTSTPDAVILPEYNRKEIDHRSRQHIGFRVFVSRYIYDFGLLVSDNQTELVFSILNIRFGSLILDDSSIDSTDIIVLDAIIYRKNFRMVCICWKMVDNQMKQACSERAKLLNARLLPGKMLTYHQQLGSGGYSEGNQRFIQIDN